MLLNVFQDVPICSWLGQWIVDCGLVQQGESSGERGLVNSVYRLGLYKFRNDVKSCTCTCINLGTC